MKLRSMVVLVLMVQTCIESLAIILPFICPDCITGFSPSQTDRDRPELFEDTSWLTNKTRVVRDYSQTARSLPQLYLLPHLWSGVLARMVSGYGCVLADQAVAGSINRWRDVVSSRRSRRI